MSCSYTKDKKTAFCSDNDPTNNDLWRCDKQKNGTWKCGKVVEQQSGPNLPGDLLKKALNLATENAVTVSPSNDTTAPRDFMSKRDQIIQTKKSKLNRTKKIPILRNFNNFFYLLLFL